MQQIWVEPNRVESAHFFAFRTRKKTKARKLLFNRAGKNDLTGRADDFDATRFDATPRLEYALSL